MLRHIKQAHTGSVMIMDYVHEHVESVWHPAAESRRYFLVTIFHFEVIGHV